MCKDKALNIDTYKKDGFKQVASVKLDPNNGQWILHNINEDYLYGGHQSWVYVIVADKEIVKLGETGQPLGIECKRGPNKGQPLIGTTNRFGRLRGFGNRMDSQYDNDTDVRIRSHLLKEAKEGQVTLWARKCEVAEIEIKVHGKKHTVKHAYHKELEKVYLNKIVNCAGRLPILNVAKI